VASKPPLTVLKNRSDFQRILKQGKRISPAPWLLIGYIKNDLGHLRCGWTLPGRVGTAVVRNKLKRWSRETLRKIENADSISMDINLVFRPQIDKDGDNSLKKLKLEDIEQAVRKGLEIAIKRI
jgi:ribonuclease P protein component